MGTNGNQWNSDGFGFGTPRIWRNKMPASFRHCPILDRECCDWSFTSASLWSISCPSGETPRFCSSLQLIYHNHQPFFPGSLQQWQLAQYGFLYIPLYTPRWQVEWELNNDDKPLTVIHTHTLSEEKISWLDLSITLLNQSMFNNVHLFSVNPI